MRSYHNIEPSGFRRGEYVGYSNGVWRIRKTLFGGWKWAARPQHDRDNDAAIIYGDTLEQVSKALDKRAKLEGN